jgi:hypothetical protein
MNTFADDYKRATVEFLDFVNTLSDLDLDKSDTEGWTPRQVIHHMADSEAQSYARLRRLIAEPGTVIQGYDENKWASEATLGYKTQGIEKSMAVISAVRDSSYELLKRVSDEQLELSGVHSESGQYSIKRWLADYTKHPVDHLNQIKKQLNNF